MLFRSRFRRRQKLCYTLLFRESAGALMDLAADPRHLGGELGMIGILHMWTRICVISPTSGSGAAWPCVMGNQSGYPPPAPNPCRNRRMERSWCPQRGLLRGKPSAAEPGKRPRTVLTEEKRPEAFPSDGKAGCRV